MREIERETEKQKVTERGRERERERKKNVRHTLCYKLYKTLHAVKHHTQSQSTFTFCLIKKYQPFNQTTILYLRDIHNTQSNHIFTQSLYL